MANAGMLAWNREADYFLQMIKDQFDTLYREGAENGRVMCLSLHPHNIGRPNAAKRLEIRPFPQGPSFLSLTFFRIAR